MLSRPSLIGALVALGGIIVVAVYWPSSDEASSSTFRAPWSRTGQPLPQVGGIADATFPDALSDPEKPLRAVYEANEHSLDPAERSLAWRAWSVCVPNFVSQDGQPIPERRLADGLRHDPARSARLSARRQLADRCAAFSRDSREAILRAAAVNAERHRAGDLRSRGELALEAVQAGNDDEALRLIREIVERKSPYELRDLSGLVARWHRGAPHTNDALRDAVLAVIGCDFGLDCGGGSLSALELCAYGGTCEGDLVERTLTAFPDIDRAQLNVVRVETATAIRDGHFNILHYFAPPGAGSTP